MASGSDSTAPGVKTPSGSNASTGTASDGGPNSRNPSNVPGSTASTTKGAGSTAGATTNPSASGSNASTGTASDGGPNSSNPSGGPTARRGDSGSSAGGTGSSAGGGKKKVRKH